MSRCFPFPPPGYESTARNDNLDLPAKEKHKEKKHKKDREKKDKEKKKDKDRSKDKHKEKKERKEKHRDKKKDKDKKDKNKDKETTRTSDEVKIGESSLGPQVGRDSKFTDELGRRTRDEEKGATNSMGESSSGSVQRRTKGLGITPGIENQNFTGTEVVPNSVSRLEKNYNGLDQPVEKYASSAQRIGVSAQRIGVSTTRMEKEKGTSDNMFAGTDNKRNHRMGLTVDRPLGSMQERSQVRTVATAHKELGVTKISKAAGTLLPNSIGTEHRSNHIVATNLTGTDDRRNHGMVCMGDKTIGSTQERVQGRSVASHKEPGGVKISNTIGTMAKNSTVTERPAVDSTFLARAEGIHAATPAGRGRSNNAVAAPALEKERGKINNVVAAPVLEKERGRSNNAVAYLFDPIDGRNDGIGDPAAAEKGRGGVSQLVTDLIPPEQRRNDGMGSSTDGKKKRDRDGDASKGEKHRDRDKREKKSKKDKDKDKERRKEKKRDKEKKKERGENKHKGDDKPRDERKLDVSVSPVIKPLASHKEDVLVSPVIKPLASHKEDVLVRPVIKPLASHKDDRKMDVSSSVIKPLASHKDDRKMDVSSSVIKPFTSLKDDNMRKEDVKSRDHGKRDMLISPGTKPLSTHLDDAKISLTDGNNKRKEIKMNGIPHENVARPSKIPRTSLPSHLPMENGGKLEPNSIVGPSLSHGAKNTITARVSDNKGPKFNGTKQFRPASLDLQPPTTIDTNGNVTRPKPPQATVETIGNLTRSKPPQTGVDTSGNVTRSKPPHSNAETSVNVTRSKPPHPDSKYLQQIYCVPKMEEWPEFDDQEWLFSRDDRRPKPKTMTEVDETRQVWAEAMHIESADVIALPYVIPF